MRSRLIAILPDPPLTRLTPPRNRENGTAF